MSFVIKNPGLLSTFQDLGRYGYQSTGISPSGVLDYKNAILANQLVANHEHEAVIEMTISGISFQVLKDTTIAIAGAEMDISRNGHPLETGRPINLSKGDFVQLGRMTNGLRTYLSVAGGFKIEKVLGSYATHTRTSMGGYEGRALQVGDVLPYNGLNNKQTNLIIKKVAKSEDNIIRIIPGPNYEDLTEEAKEVFVNYSYKITRSNDRMGIRLDGHVLETKDGVHDILSEPTQLGNIQVPKNGLPIILLNDRQTTGGYKRMASIAKIDLPKLVQMEPEQELQFKMISLEEATQLYIEDMKKILNKEYLMPDNQFKYYRRIQAERIKELMER